MFAMADAPDRVRATLHAWMTKVLRDRGWSAFEWTRRAEVSDTSLSRFLKNPQTGSVPSAVTLYRLAEAAGSSPYFASKGWAEVSIVPPRHVQMFVTELSPQARRLYLNQNAVHSLPVMTSVYHPSDQAFGLQVQTQHMSAGGIFPGDYVVCEPPHVLAPMLTSTVAVLLKSQVACFKYMPPWLQPMSTNPDHQAMLLDGVPLAGVVVQLQRPMLPRTEC